MEKLQNWQRGARLNVFVPAVSKRTKPGDPLQVQVEPVVPVPQRKQHDSDLEGHTIDARAQQNFVYFQGQHTARGARFLLALVFA